MHIFDYNWYITVITKAPDVSGLNEFTGHTRAFSFMSFCK